MANAFDGAIVEVEMGDLKCRRSGHAAPRRRPRRSHGSV
jgi:hypothetical protein